MNNLGRASAVLRREYATFSKSVQVPYYPCNDEGKAGWNQRIEAIRPGYIDQNHPLRFPTRERPGKRDHFAADRILRSDVNDALRELAHRDIALTKEGLAPLIPKVEEIHITYISELRTRLEALRANLRRHIEARLSEDQLQGEKITRLESAIGRLEGASGKLSKLQQDFLNDLDRYLKTVQDLNPTLDDLERRIKKLEH